MCISELSNVCCYHGNHEVRGDFCSFEYMYLIRQLPANMAGYFYESAVGEPKYNSTSKNTQPYWLVNRLIRCLLCNCFLLTFIKSLFFFIHTKIARFCLICWITEFGALFPFRAGRKPVHSFMTVIGCWARASPHFPAFFERARTHMSLGIIDEMNYSVELHLVW